MSNKQWEDFDFGNNDDIEVIEQNKTKRSKKRKWREIENVKERQRLKRELSSYDSYTF